MSSSAICQNFLQNAWKKELCSNCFKSKDEHEIATALNNNNKLKTINLISSLNITSILKDPNKKFKPKLNVAFTKDLKQFIGYGGEDWLSEEDPIREGISEENLDDDDLLLTADSDEDDFIKEIRALTKKNTNYNTVSLNDIIEEKKSYAHLMLGKPIVNSEGKKQTLLVSVTPFGEETTSSSNSKKFSNNKFNSNNEIKTTKSVDQPDNNANNNNNKEEKSLLDEISETLEKSNNSILGRRNKTPLRETTAEINNNNIIKDEIVIKERRISLTRTPALKGREIYQTSTAKIELLNTKNFKTIHPPLKENNNNNTDDATNDNDDDKTKPLIVEDNNNKTKAIISECIIESREQAGKPDGSEDDDTLEEVPALPLTPPPILENQNSFLHPRSMMMMTNNTELAVLNEKPKIPSKPATVLIRKPLVMQKVGQINNNINNNTKLPAMSTFTTKEPSSVVETSDLESRCNNNNNNKRRAPKPPPEESLASPPSPNNLRNNNSPPLFTRNSVNSINGDCPVVREKEKRERNERASSCAPKIYGNNNEIIYAKTSSECDYEIHPAPIPRKSLSISSDNLMVGEENKRKKGRFSLKKFLRMGSTKDITRLSIDSMNNAVENFESASNKPRARLVIVHPSELNGSKVEVVSKSDQIIDGVKSAQKPPPPPRNYDNCRPPISNPPKSVEILNQQKALSRSNSNSSATTTKKTETVYANIGEVRSSIVPNKPVRTASMREREAASLIMQQNKQIMQKNKNIYESINSNNNAVNNNKPLLSSENVYDYVNGNNNNNNNRCSSDSDSSGKNSPKSKKTGLINKRSESSIDVSGEYFKYGNIPRSMSLTYCGSETESEIYAPYSFYSSETEVTEDDHDWIQNGRTHKLRSRKGRSIVHKNLEDNYGAVIVANHEALAQVLENIQQTIFVQPALRGLKMSSNLRLSDFSIKSGISPINVGTRMFYQAFWGAQHVTLMFSSGLTNSSTLNLGTFHLNSITEFNDLVPNNNSDEYSNNTESNRNNNNKEIQATISVLPWLQIHTIQSYGEFLKTTTKSNQEMDSWRDGFFVMLQLVNALKMLQAQGIEELPLNLNSFILSKEIDRESFYKLSIIQGTLSSELTSRGSSVAAEEMKYGTLCMCASKALLNLMQSDSKTTKLIQSLLNNERSVSLTQVKAVLEFTLWGPTDVSLGNTVKERELILQRWLDLQRATVLHGLVCARVQLTVYENCHLLFLVRSNARMMSDASMLIESNNLKYTHSSKA